MIGACVENSPGFMSMICMGVTELMLAFVIIGWLWSIIHGFIMIVVACSCKRPTTAPTRREVVEAVPAGYDIKE